jgi:divalent metal cation (Fe/Co/Zn/Cd) transporter
MATPAGSIGTSRRTIVSLQVVTFAWMLVECSVALFAAWQAKSVSLLAFGSDSLVELISAAVVLLQFTPRFHISQARAARSCGSLLYGLAGAVSVMALAGLFEKAEASTSRLGIAVTGAALLLMPLLARKKRAIAEQIGNKALRADAVQSATCAYLAGLTLAGLILRSAFGLHWLDQVAALLAVPILIVEGKRARKGQGCC